MDTKKLNGIFTVLLFIFVIQSGCSDVRKSEITTIDIEAQINNPVTLQASDLIAKMRYIVLETTDSSLLSTLGNTIIQKNGYFFIRDRQNLYIFDNKGKYVRQISNIGQGPNEYVRLFSFDVDDNNTYLYDGIQQRILIFDYNNNHLKDIDIRSENLTGISHVLKSSSGFICYRYPMLFPEKYKEPIPDLILVDEAGKEKKILHYRTLNIDMPLPFMYIPHFKRYKDKIFFYPPLQDTIFSIDMKEEKITPEIVINRGRHAVYPADLDDATERKLAYEKGLFIKTFTINDKWLILHCEYEKNPKVVFMYNFSTKELKRVSKIINDIDNTFDITFPHDFTDNQLLDEKLAFEIIGENKMPELIKNLKEDDNQIIRISDLK
ncbi:MAG: 6-bladed beta-propeller [Prevotellaceae bacterium]|jgi:hypothetical protein|nr:6-bladed beta-propeller [Prevotellaceae bacterium]